ncbi:MAG: rhomboid family intramembrane serine protease [Cyclobacteriaceae bacterium]|nr:rhomboid family intramembrane serine protease [Cyclobacteriaceae bacterium]
MLEEFKHAFSRPNNSHIQLILINVAVFVVLAIFMVFSLWFGFGNVFEVVHKQFSLPSGFGDFVTRPWTLITYFFTHDLRGLMHILFNMLALYWFGKLLVSYLGSDKVIAVYVLGGLAGGALYLMVYNLIPNPPEFLSGRAELVGASASVFAIMVAAATLLPDYTFFLLFFGPVKIKWIAAIYIFLSFLGSVGQNAGGEIAHLGGALIGFVYIKQLQVGVNWGGWITATLNGIAGLFSSRRTVKVTYRKEASAKRPHSATPSSISQQEIDAILDKISEGGYESLSKDEREKLFKASKK